MDKRSFNAGSVSKRSQSARPSNRSKAQKTQVTFRKDYSKVREKDLEEVEMVDLPVTMPELDFVLATPAQKNNVRPHEIYD
jgi:hypothetical protein